MKMKQAKEKSAGSASNQDAQNYGGDATSTSGKLDFKREDTVSSRAAQPTTGLDKEEQNPIKGNNDEKDGDTTGKEQQPKRRRQNIMNEVQLAIIEKALSDDPEMRKNPDSVKSWAQELSKQGSEITSVQLQNWISNRQFRQRALAAQKQEPIKGAEQNPVKGENATTSCAAQSKRGIDKEEQNPIEGNDDEKDGDTKSAYQQPKRGRRSIMNDVQIDTIEKALLDEPEILQSWTLLLSWAENLSSLGPKITSVQLDAWLRHQKNRKKALSAQKQNPIKGNDEEQPRKRTEGFINDIQFETIQKALLDEPNMQKNPASLQLWAATLSDQGSKITPKQLRAWIYRQRSKQREHAAQEAAREDYMLDPGQLVRVVDEARKDVGSGKVFQVEGQWHEFDNLEDARVCVVELTECKDSNWPVPYPSQGAGRTLAEATVCNGGYMRVAWDISRVHKA